MLREHIDAEELPPVVTVEQALDPASPLVQRPEAPRAIPTPANILREWTFGWGTPPDRAPGARAMRFPMVTHFASSRTRLPRPRMRAA